MRINNGLHCKENMSTTIEAKEVLQRNPIHRQKVFKPVLLPNDCSAMLTNQSHFDQYL